MIDVLVSLAVLSLESWALPLDRDVCRDSSYGTWSEPDADARVVRVPLDGIDLEAHFPVGSIDPFACTWYTHQLWAMQESPLPSPADGLVFRLTWLRTFHHPFAFRVTLAEGASRAQLTWRQLDGAGGYEPGSLSRVEHVTLGESATAEFMTLLSAAAICEAAPDEALGFDGAQWIFELSLQDRYCLHDSWGGRGSMGELGHFLIDFAQVNEDSRY